MTEGKLVRDLIPELIRESGRDVEVQYLSGADLVKALVAKLFEEAQEVSEAINDRESLLDELADLREVMLAMMTLRGIQPREVLEAAERKTALRGRFADGAWLAYRD